MAELLEEEGKSVDLRISREKTEYIHMKILMSPEKKPYNKWHNLQRCR